MERQRARKENALGNVAKVVCRSKVGLLASADSALDARVVHVLRCNKTGELLDSRQLMNSRSTHPCRNFLCASRCQSLPGAFGNALFKCTASKISSYRDVTIRWGEYQLGYKEPRTQCHCQKKYPRWHACTKHPLTVICTEYKKFGDKLSNGLDTSMLEKAIKRLWQTTLSAL